MPQVFPEQASSFAPHVDALYGFMIAVTAFFSILIGTLVVVFAIKYRRPEHEVAPRSTSRAPSRSPGPSSRS
jgi:heme/copper-type cytochrome/quinol oxidase subunit 2